MAADRKGRGGGRAGGGGGPRPARSSEADGPEGAEGGAGLRLVKKPPCPAGFASRPGRSDTWLIDAPPSVLESSGGGDGGVRGPGTAAHLGGVIASGSSSAVEESRGSGAILRAREPPGFRFHGAGRGGRRGCGPAPRFDESSLCGRRAGETGEASGPSVPRCSRPLGDEHGLGSGEGRGDIPEIGAAGMPPWAGAAWQALLTLEESAELEGLETPRAPDTPDTPGIIERSEDSEDPQRRPTPAPAPARMASGGCGSAAAAAQAESLFGASVGVSFDPLPRFRRPSPARAFIVLRDTWGAFTATAGVRRKAPYVSAKRARGCPSCNSSELESDPETESARPPRSSLCRSLCFPPRSSRCKLARPTFLPWKGRITGFPLPMEPPGRWTSESESPPRAPEEPDDLLPPPLGGAARRAAIRRFAAPASDTSETYDWMSSGSPESLEPAEKTGFLAIPAPGCRSATDTGPPARLPAEAPPALTKVSPLL